MVKILDVVWSAASAVASVLREFRVFLFANYGYNSSQASILLVASEWNTEVPCTIGIGDGRAAKI